jgi:hypothetical protein
MVLAGDSFNVIPGSAASARAHTMSFDMLYDR